LRADCDSIGLAGRIFGCAMRPMSVLVALIATIVLTPQSALAQTSAIIGK
jgi:hypothetical protein